MATRKRRKRIPPKNIFTANDPLKELGKWWDEKEGLELVGLAALGLTGAAVVTVVVFPNVVGVAAGGALAATGAKLLKTNF